MRQGTILFWLAAIVLFAFFGLALLKFVAVAILSFLVLLLLVLAVAAWALKRRMQRKLHELQRAVQHAQVQADLRRRNERRKREAVDTELVDKDDGTSDDRSR